MSEFTNKVDEMITHLEIAISAIEAVVWRPMDSAPTDGTIVNVMGRYKDATAGFPRYAGFYQGEWHEFTRNPPEPLICWAWRPRDPFTSWPQEVAA